MEIVLLFGVSILPGLFLLWYYDRHDSARPEPRRMLWKAFKWGVIATFFAGVIEKDLFLMIPSLVDHAFLRAFVIAFVVAALTEEALKLFIVRKIIYKSPHFNEVMDGVIYAVAASLGFATLENLYYVFEGGIHIGFARAALAVPAHALFSGIMGYYIGKGKFAKSARSGRLLVLKGFLWAVLYHGLYDFFLIAGGIYTFFVIPLLVSMHFQLQHLIKHAHRDDTKMK